MPAHQTMTGKADCLRGLPLLLGMLLAGCAGTAPSRSSHVDLQRQPGRADVFAELDAAPNRSRQPARVIAISDPPRPDRTKESPAPQPAQPPVEPPPANPPIIDAEETAPTAPETPPAALEDQPAEAAQPAIAVQPAEPEAPRLAYTAPSATVRHLAVTVAAATLQATTPDRDPAAEVSESLVLSGQGAIGRLGVTAPPTMIAGAVVSRPGTARGPLTGLGFATPGNNLFSARTNPLSGPGGRCADLARAGFFGGNRGNCERTLSRR